MKFAEKTGSAIRFAILTWSSLTATSILARSGAEEETLGYVADGLNTVPGADQVSSTEGRVRFEGVGRKGGLLCIGSSYAWHAPSPEKLKWNGDWGMAASSREKDVVHRIWRELRRHHPDAPLCIAQSAEWERHYDEDETLLEREYGETKSFSPDWIVVITRVANAPRTKSRTEPLGDHYAKMVEWFRRTNPKAKVVLTAGVNSTVDASVRKYAQEHGFPVVDFGEFMELPGMRATGLYEHKGVSSHPSDAGFAEMARRYLKALGVACAAQTDDIRGKFDFTRVGPEEYWPMRRELRAFFPSRSQGDPTDPTVVRHWQDVWRELQDWAAAHPEADALDIRCENYRIMGRTFLPILFRESPFYYEACVQGGYYGVDAFNPLSAFRRKVPMPGAATERLCRRFLTERKWIPGEDCRVLAERSRQLYSYICGPFVDECHTAPPIRKILEGGFRGIKEKVEEALAACPHDDVDGRRYLEAMALGLDTVHGIQLRYRDEAQRRIHAGAAGAELKRLKRIAESAARCPWEPPRTFFEGLNTLGFCREIFAYVEGLPNNCSFGRLDAWLIGLYRADIAAGRITEAEARDLLCRFMLLSDCTEDGFTEADTGMAHEKDAPVTLGGCDDDGRPVWNELTQMVLEEHQRMAVISPKLHVRFSCESPKEYLELLAKEVIGGHCVFAMFNDDTHIPGFVRQGYPLARARDYEGVGCWEGYVSGDTDVSAVNYTSALQPFVASIYVDEEKARRARVRIEPIEGCADMEGLKRTAFGNYIRFLRDLTSDYTRYGRHFAKVSPRPLFSACLNGCIERRRDEFDMGLERHQRTITVGFLSNVVDSMLAIEKVVFEDRFATMSEFLAAVRANWRGERNQAIRNEVLKAPCWGDNSPKSNALMKWWIDSIANELEGLRTDQGGEYRLSCMIYREYMSWGAKTRATPDGRRDGERFAQGFAPSDLRCRSGLADVFHAIGSLDHTKLCASNANLSFGGEDFTPETLAAVFQVFAEGGAHLLQPNCNTVETLLDAQKHPERHLDLMVKVCGFSTRFVTLSPRFQREIIERNRLH